MAARVTIVGAGIAGAACARELLAAGLDVSIVDRGRAPGGRMAAPQVHGRRTDLGAAYFTVSDDDFAEVVAGWRDRGLAREWTDTFTVIEHRDRRTTQGPMRYATPGGLRSLVRDLLPEGVEVGYQQRIDSLGELDHEVDAVVLAMPDPQAERLAPEVVEWVAYDPVISVAVGWDEPQWQPFDAAFVNDDPDVSFVADDGARRGDGAAVLVAHTTADRAWEHLDAPADAERAVLAALARTLRVDLDPEWTHTHRWTYAKPAATHGDEPFGLLEHRGRPLGLATDSWCPTGKPRVESAWLSGRALGRALAGQLSSRPT